MSDHLKLLTQRSIALYPIYIELTGSATGGILLSQMMYWFSKKDTFYKTNDEFVSETKLSIRELKSAKTKIKTLPFIQIEVKGVPAKTFYTIDWALFERYLQNNVPASQSEAYQPVSPKRTNCVVQNVPTITKTTTKITTNISKAPKSPKQEIQVSEKLNLDKVGKFDLSVDQYNQLAKKYNLPKPRIFSNATKKRLFNTIRALEAAGSNWVEYLKIISQSPHLLGKNDRDWICDFSWIITPANFEKIFNGKYLAKQQAPKLSQGDQWFKRVKNFKERNFWVDSWGERPGVEGCQVPMNILQQHGYGVTV